MIQALDAFIWLLFSVFATGLMVNTNLRITGRHGYWVSRLFASLLTWWSLRMFLLLLAGQATTTISVLLLHILLVSMLRWFLVQLRRWPA